MIAAAEQAGFEVLVTTDKNLKYQQNLGARTIAILVLSTTSWPRIRADLPSVIKALEVCGSGGYVEVSIG